VNKIKQKPNPVSAELLPDFCTNQIVLTAMLIGELLAIVLSISYGGWDFGMLEYLAYASLFIQWITITDIAVLCFCKRWFILLPPNIMMALIYMLLQIITLLISQAGFLIASNVEIYSEWSDLFQYQLLGSNLATSMIVTALTMHYFYINHQSKLRYNAQTHAKIEALQARMRPHFLFNSMNTIANLIHDDPNKAEDAVLDLSELFRSSLGKHDFVSLSEEISITKRYTNIEALRLGERLNIHWHSPRILPNMQMPALMLQPLVENAIYHGVEPIAEGGLIEVKVDVSDDMVQFFVSNPIPEGVPVGRRKGNSIALNNIRQRLSLAYGEDASIEFDKEGGIHTVILTIPIRGNYENSDR